MLDGINQGKFRKYPLKNSTRDNKIVNQINLFPIIFDNFDEKKTHPQRTPKKIGNRTNANGNII